MTELQIHSSFAPAAHENSLLPPADVTFTHPPLAYSPVLSATLLPCDNQSKNKIFYHRSSRILLHQNTAMYEYYRMRFIRRNDWVPSQFKLSMHDSLIIIAERGKIALCLGVRNEAVTAIGFISLSLSLSVRDEMHIQMKSEIYIFNSR